MEVTHWQIKSAMQAIEDLRQAVDEGDDMWACLAMTECIVRHMPALREHFKSENGFDVSAYSDHDATVVWVYAYQDESIEPRKPEAMKRVFFS